MVGEQLVAPVPPGVPARLGVGRRAGRGPQRGHAAAPVEQGERHPVTLPADEAPAPRESRRCNRPGTVRRYAGGMPLPPDSDRRVVPGAELGASSNRLVILVGGFVLAAAATLVVFLTDNPQYLRIAVVAVAWAFVLAAFAAGRRGGDRAAAAAREQELRHAYELELEREVVARREYELGLENELRRETEDSVRDELDALRGEIASLSGLRDEVARVSELRGD